ncbi:MAG: DEAD/DEAH box helicase [Magnetococcales bacterium]|nr:DEAD/DEAH box helicase [Magnetococcales bacterium]
MKILVPQLELRPYQSMAVESARDELRNGNHRLIIHAPTGAGKTVIASHIIQSALGRGNQVLFLGHRRELINQASGKLDALSIDHGVMMAKHPRTDPTQPVQVASIQTLVNRLDGMEGSNLIIIDEAHRAEAPTYKKILDAYPKAVVLGLTATPERSDGKGLGDIFQAIVPVSSVSELTAQGYLVPAKVYAPSRPDMTGVGIKRGDYDSATLSERVDQPDLVGDLPKHWLEYAKGRPTVVFAVNIKHSLHIRDSFLAVGVRAEHVDGDTPTDERDAILSRLASGETKVVCNVGILTEGWDLPQTSCCILARPTKSVGLYLQMVGRVLRTFDGKSDAIVLDHAGCVHEHGFPDDERQWSLEWREKQRRGHGRSKAPAPIRICKHCFLAMRPSASQCPACGWKSEVKSREVVHEDGELKAIEKPPLRPHASQRQVMTTLENLRQTASAKGYKRGWIWYRLKATFGERAANEAMRSRRAA